MLGVTANVSFGSDDIANVTADVVFNLRQLGHAHLKDEQVSAAVWQGTIVRIRLNISCEVDVGEMSRSLVGTLLAGFPVTGIFGSLAAIRTAVPSVSPTIGPTGEPTARPTTPIPSLVPVPSPTAVPTNIPSPIPTERIHVCVLHVRPVPMHAHISVRACVHAQPRTYCKCAFGRERH